MAQPDRDVGMLLHKLDELGIAENTIVIYSTANGAEKFTWPGGGTIPFLSATAMRRIRSFRPGGRTGSGRTQDETSTTIPTMPAISRAAPSTTSRTRPIEIGARPCR